MTRGCIDVTISGVVRMMAYYECHAGRNYILLDLPYDEVRTADGVNLNYIIAEFKEKYDIDIPVGTHCKISYLSSGGSYPKPKRTQPSLQAVQKKRKANHLGKVWGTLLFRNSLSVLRKRK